MMRGFEETHREMEEQASQHMHNLQEERARVIDGLHQRIEEVTRRFEEALRETEEGFEQRSRGLEEERTRWGVALTEVDRGLS